MSFYGYITVSGTGNILMKPILSYLDFREYLRDFYREKKKTTGFSFREFAKTAGFSSPVFIKLVMDGKANLAQPSATKLCKAMGLKKNERRYFKNLVRFGQAKTIEGKVQYIERLKSYHPSVFVSGLTEDQFAYFSKWYHPVIRELITMTRFDGDCGKLAALVDPPITAKEAKESLELLLKLRLVEKNGSGQYVATSRFLTTEGMETGALAVRNAQKTMAQLAARAVDAMPPENRDISGVTVSISNASLVAIRDELQKCRRRIFEIAAGDRACDSVYRVNLHLFPISGKIPGAQTKRGGGGHNE
jgi:uncharacterized protein (TIGR02147 family)